MPATFGNKEVVWTLTSNGVTEKAYGTLRPQYAVDETVMMANFGAGGQTGFAPDMTGNKPPKLTVEGEKKRTAKVGEPVTLSAVATDDGKPRRGRCRRFSSARATSCRTPPPACGCRGSTIGGAGKIEFDPPQTKVWEDHRDGGNSPWSAGWSTPPAAAGNKWTAKATFSEPGTYVLRALATTAASSPTTT